MEMPAWGACPPVDSDGHRGRLAARVRRPCRSAASATVAGLDLPAGLRGDRCHGKRHTNSHTNLSLWPAPSRRRALAVAAENWARDLVLARRPVRPAVV